MKKDHVKNAKSMTVAVKTLDGPMRNGRERICKWKAKTALSGGAIMADCSKTVDFLRELNRMHEAFNECRNCPLSGWKRKPSGPRCIEFIKEYTEQTIAIVQKWSDEHLVMTWESKLQELLHHADIKLVTKTCCPGAFFKGAPISKSKRTFCPRLSDGCDKCWAEEYKEENNG